MPELAEEAGIHGVKCLLRASNQPPSPAL